MMTFALSICGAALLALSAAAGAAVPVFSPAAPATAKGLNLGATSSSMRLEYTSFSKLYGSRTVLTADSKLGVGHYTRFIFSASGGQRSGSNSTIRSAQVGGTVDHDWTDRLSTQSSASLASNGTIFAKTQFGQDISYELGHGLVGTIGGKYASYGNRNNVATWSAGAAYYMRGATLRYRFSLLDSSRLGRSTAHLASVRLQDPGGSGSTELWAGHGTSLYEIVNLPTAAAGKFTSVAVRRVQPIASGMAVNLGLNRSWFHTPTGNYRGTGVSLGFSVTKLKL
jgi:YaiO family outer membrane protein